MIDQTMIAVFEQQLKAIDNEPKHDCPVCGGDGGYWDLLEFPNSLPVYATKRCLFCQGQGYVMPNESLSEWGSATID